MTTVYNYNKIKHIGFSPRCKNEDFYYPGRVYFIKGSTSREDIEKIGKELSDKNTSLGNKGKYVLLTIDIDKIPNDVVMCYDSNYPNGIYTRENISQDTIIDVEEINFK